MAILEGAPLPPPMIADVSGSLAIGRERGRASETRRLTAEILRKSFPGRLGELTAELATNNPGLALQMGQSLGFNQDPEASSKFFAGAIQGAHAIASTVGSKEAVAALIEWRGILEARGLETAALDTLIQSGIDTPDEFTEGLGLAKDALVEQGFLKDTRTEAQVEVVKKRRFEVRGELRKQIKVIRQDVVGIEENFGKIVRLVEQTGLGNRVAAAQAIIAMIKLGDESTVKSDELVAGLNRQSPIAAIVEIMRGNGNSEQLIDAITTAIDPLNPLTIKAEDVLAVANAIVGARVPSIQASFAEARELAETNLPRSGIRSIFTSTLTNRVAGLSKLLKTQKKELTDDEKRARIAELEALGPP